MKKFCIVDDNIFNLDNASNIWKQKKREDNGEYKHRIAFSYPNHRENGYTNWTSEVKRDEEFAQIEKILKQQKKGGTMNSLKEYFKKNQDVFLTLAIIILLDNFLFNGQFRMKITSMIEGLITKTEKKLNGGE
jgi:hypothetical protein